MTGNRAGVFSLAQTYRQKLTPEAPSPPASLRQGGAASESILQQCKVVSVERVGDIVHGDQLGDTVVFHQA